MRRLCTPNLQVTKLGNWRLELYPQVLSLKAKGRLAWFVYFRSLLTSSTILVVVLVVLSSSNLLVGALERWDNGCREASIKKRRWSSNSPHVLEALVEYWTLDSWTSWLGFADGGVLYSTVQQKLGGLYPSRLQPLFKDQIYVQMCFFSAFLLVPRQTNKRQVWGRI